MLLLLMDGVRAWQSSFPSHGSGGPRDSWTGWAPFLVRSQMRKIPFRATSYLTPVASSSALLPLCALVTVADLTWGQLLKADGR